ncbi:MAG: hypothetical protein GF313_06470 [Caldithrix sp.]|nr:hypothetical protein [Caldithrix sp.]
MNKHAGCHRIARRNNIADPNAGDGAKNHGEQQEKPGVFLNIVVYLAAVFATSFQICGPEEDSADNIW